MYKINSFWKTRLGATKSRIDSPLVPGWSFIESGFSTFREAPLTLNTELGGDPMDSSVLLVSAPGAVGKSTLARQIAYETGSVYVDLARAAPVGDNTLSGGLLKSKIVSYWDSGDVTMLIDGLDEARLKVTQGSFQAFLTDIAELSKSRNLPTILFGRTGSVQDSWLLLSDDIDVSVLEIGYYSLPQSVDFAEAKFHELKPETPHIGPAREAIELLLQQLRDQTESEGDRFAGYAPVLQTVARRVAKEDNPSLLIAQINRGDHPVTLKSIVSGILSREQTKVRGVSLENKDLTAKLYSPVEQLGHLVAHIYGGGRPAAVSMSPRDAQTYSDALSEWVPDHPFVDGGTSASSVVFDAVINAWALKCSDDDISSRILKKELSRGASANPFLCEFYIDNLVNRPTLIRGEHIGIVYDSLRAGLSLGDSASLVVDAAEHDKENAIVEITLTSGDNDRRLIKLDTKQTNRIHLGARIEDVEIVMPITLVELGVDQDVVLGVCRIGRTEEAKECWSGLGSDYRLHESMLSQIVG